ncbi:alkaline phosphatase family protein [Candidatus Undinarchaeota archaeon]
MKKLNWVLIDSFRKDYLKHAPFLDEICKTRSRLEPVVGYQQYLASFFTGMQPDRINVWNIFRYSKNSSLFGWTRFLPKLSLFDIKQIKYGLDLLSYLKIRTLDMSKVEIPISIMKNFDLSMRKSITAPNVLDVPTVFDKLRENNLTFTYIKGSIYDEGKASVSSISHILRRSDLQSIELAKKSNSALRFLYLVELDGISHRFGPTSKEVKEHIKTIDAELEDLLKGENVIMQSDHGMVETKKKINIEQKLDGLGYRNGRDYLMFLDSVIARFWFFNKKAKEEIMKLLRDTKGGKILADAEKKKLGIFFNDKRYGELFFIADYGNVIVPNYFQKEIPKGMHGYLPERDEYGIFGSNIKGMQKGQVHYTDIAPTILDYFNIRLTCNGKSLIVRN